MPPPSEDMLYNSDGHRESDYMASDNAQAAADSAAVDYTSYLPKRNHDRKMAYSYEYFFCTCNT